MPVRCGQPGEAGERTTRRGSINVGVSLRHSVRRPKGRDSVKSVRFRIKNIMIVVALVALNLGAFRALFATRQVDLLLGGELLFGALQFGAARAIKNHDRRRLFWLGFVGGGAITTFSFLSRW